MTKYPVRFPGQTRRKRETKRERASDGAQRGESGEDYDDDVESDRSTASRFKRVLRIYIFTVDLIKG